jgi:hypothetical protein
LAPRFEIVSLRQSQDESTWRALVLEGEHLGHFRFAAEHGATADQARAMIHQTALKFDVARSAIAQFQELRP